MDNNGIIWNYSDNMDNMTSPIFSDTAEVTVPYTDPILHQVTQPVPQTGGAVPQTGGAVPQTGGAVGGMMGAVGGKAPQTGGSVFSPIPHARVSVGLPASQTGNVVVQHTSQTSADGGMIGAIGGAVPQIRGSVFHQFRKQELW